MRPKMTPIHVDQIVELTRAGVGAESIGRQLGVTARTVCRVRKDQGISKTPHRKMTDDELATAKQLLDDGASYPEVGRTLGFNRDTIAARFPGYTWTFAQVSEHALFCRYNRNVLR